MKFIEDQLVSALKETPLETNFSVSVTALEMAGIAAPQQESWLRSRRAPQGQRAWRRLHDHWHYCPVEAADASGPPANTTPARRPVPSRVASAIIVKPLAKLPARQAMLRS